MVVPWKTENVMAEICLLTPSIGVKLCCFLTHLMTSQLFWHSMTGTGFWGVYWEGFSPPNLIPHWWGHISHVGGPELWGVPVWAAKCSGSNLGSKGSTMVQKYCPIQDGTLYGRKFGCPITVYVYAILSLNCMLFFWTLSISWRLCPLFAAQISVTSFSSQLSFDLVVLSYFHSFSGSLPDFFVCSPILAMYHCQKHVQGQVL